MSVVEILNSAREICLYAKGKLNRLSTLRDTNNLRSKFRLMPGRNDVVRVKELLCRRSNLPLLEWERVVRFVFVAAGSVRHFVAMYSKVMLMDGTHHPTCDEYTLWQAVVFGDWGLGRPIFYAPILNECRFSYRRAIAAMENIIPSTGNVKRIIIYLSWEAVRRLSSCSPRSQDSFLAFSRIYGNASPLR